MDNIKARLDRLESIESIRNLIASYGPLADSGVADAVASLWHDDGEYEVGGFGTAKGHEAIGDLIRGQTHQDLVAQGCAHVLSPHSIELESDRAKAVGYSIVFRNVGTRFEPWRVSANSWTLTRKDHEWRVQKRQNAPLDGSAHAIEILRGPHVT